MKVTSRTFESLFTKMFKKSLILEGIIFCGVELMFINNFMEKVPELSCYVILAIFVKSLLSKISR